MTQIAFKISSYTTTFLNFQLTDSDNSASEDTCSSNNALSYHEFVKQYKDLSDRLQHLKEQLTNNKASSLSEKYLDKVS